MKEIITELTGYMNKVETFDKDAAQDGQALHAYLIELTQMQARANFLMADYQRKFRQEKKVAYLNMIASETASQKYFSASIAKDYIDACCHETGYIFDLAERLSRLCTHTSAAVITIVSSLKSERQLARF